MLVAEAAEEREEAPLATEETESEVEAEIEPETEAEIEPETEDALLWEDEPDPEDPAEGELDDGAEVEVDPPDEADDELETALQERSNNGVVLKVEPTIPKLGEGNSWVGVLEGEPPSVDITKERACNSVPVRLGVSNGGNSVILSRTANWPSSLSDPNILSGRALGSRQSSVE